MSLLDAYAKTVVDQADKIKAQADEIERLRMQVFFAAGCISTSPEFADKSPDEVLKFIQKSSPFQQKESE